MLSKVYVLGLLEVGLRCWNELWISSCGGEKGIHNEVVLQDQNGEARQEGDLPLNKC